MHMDVHMDVHVTMTMAVEKDVDYEKDLPSHDTPVLYTSNRMSVHAIIIYLYIPSQHSTSACTHTIETWYTCTVLIWSPMAIWDNSRMFRACWIINIT